MIKSLKNIFELFPKYWSQNLFYHADKSASIVSEFQPKKILILKKITRYEFNKLTHKNFTEDQLKAHLKATGSDYEGLLVRHNEHYKRLNGFLKGLEEQNVEIKVVDRFGYNYDIIAWADLVVTAGGDGTFLLGASRIMDDKPIIGLNTDPLRSEGYLCLPRRFSQNLKMAVTHIFGGKFDWLWRQRITVKMSDISQPIPVELAELELQYPEHRFLEHIREAEETTLAANFSSTRHGLYELPFRALNEVFLGESLSARVSYYELSIDDSNNQKQKSSGVTVCTGTGSSSWSFHINHIPEDAVKNILELTQQEMSDIASSSMNISPLSESNIVKTVCRRYNSSLCFSPEEPMMAYTIRDPIKNKIFHVAYPRGFSKKMTVRSRMWDAHVVIDGGVSYRFNDGAVAHLEIDPKYALRCVTMHAY